MTNENADKQALARLQEGLALHRQGKLEEARYIYNDALKCHPQHAQALQLLGLIAAQSNDPTLASDYLERSLAIDPNNATARYNHGNVLTELGRFTNAIENYDHAIALNPAYFAAHNGLGNALKGDHQPFAALDSYKRALAIQPAYADAYVNLGLTFVELNQYRNALACYDKALTLTPDDATVLQHRKVAMVKFKLHQEIIGNSYSGPYKKPEQALMYCKRGDAFLMEKKYAAALSRYDEALAIQPDLADAYYGRGVALSLLQQKKSAIDSFDRAIAHKPGYAHAYLQCAIALFVLEQHTDAINCFNKALELKEQLTDAYAGRAAAQIALSQHAQAVESFNLALAADPNYGNYALGQRLYTKMRNCHWQDYHQQVQEQIQRIQQGQLSVCMPFAALAFIESAKVQHQVAQRFTNNEFPVNPSLGPIKQLPREAKIRIVYISVDFKNHPVSYLTAELFEIHDRARFEIIAFAYGPNTHDVMRTRFEKSFDQFIDIHDKSDLEVAELARAMRVNIVIDLTGLTASCRTGILACRMAPIQISYLGYPGTMGASYIDYLIADQQLIPANLRPHYTEKIAYLPVFQVNDRQRKVSDKIFTREELDLPETGFIFCCFNNNFKITPMVFESWMRILHRTENSVLFLLSTTDWTEDNLKREAIAQGIDATRLVFGKRLLPDEYLARYRNADLFLDTFPFNAGATASDALWAGLPVLTRPGETLCSRMASSLLLAVGLAELIAPDMQAYEDLAVELATRPGYLSGIRSKLQHQRLRCPLFDTPLFARHIESAYSQMVERYQANLPPDHIFVEPMQIA